MAKLARACNTWRMDIVAQSIAVFLEDAPRHLATLGEAVERDDPHALARAAHSLKGAARALGARGEDGPW